jgi:hypothetical protein
MRYREFTATCVSWNAGDSKKANDRCAIKRTRRKEKKRPQMMIGVGILASP